MEEMRLEHENELKKEATLPSRKCTSDSSPGKELACNNNQDMKSMSDLKVPNQDSAIYIDCGLSDNNEPTTGPALYQTFAGHMRVAS